MRTNPIVRDAVTSLRFGLVLAACTAMTVTAAPAQYPGVPPPPPCHDVTATLSNKAGSMRARASNSRALGVVLFQNTVADDDYAFLGRALADRMVARLRESASVDVVETRKFGYEQMIVPDGAAAISHSLGTGYLLGARVGRDESGAITLRVRIVRPIDSSTVWSGSVRSTFRDLPATVDRLVNEALGAVTGREVGRGKLAGWSDPPDGEVVEHFLRGVYYGSLNTSQGFEYALAQYDSATRLDPAFAPGFARSALTIASLLEWGWWNESPVRVRELTERGIGAADRALALDSVSAYAWMARGALLGFRNPRSYAGVRAAYTHALAYAPRNPMVHHWFGRALMQLGERSAARRELARALDLAPRDAAVMYDMAQIDRRAGRFSSACALLDSAVSADPTAAQAYLLRALTRTRRGELRFAWADAETGGRLGWPLWGQAVAAVIDAKARDSSSARSRARALLRTSAAQESGIRQWSGEYLAMALASSGDTDGALDVLESVRTRGARLWFALMDPEFESLRRNGRFRALLAASRPQR